MKKRTSTILVAIIVAGLFAWFFANALFRGGMFAFRDAAHYYYPLFKLVSQQWSAGRLPLWNPYENLGQPLAGDPTASVFYPGKLIFALPLSFDWAYRIYITAHVLLAAWTSFRLARRWQAGTVAAGVCAVSYAFCGNVLFQYCNVVFLVGAAWLPLAVLTAERMLTQRSPRQAVLFGIVLAMMTLGGDPQMAYNAGVMAAGYALLLWWRQRATRDKNDEQRACRAATRLCSMRPLMLALAALVALVLSAVQVLPSMEFVSLSGRTADSYAESFLCRNLEPGTHAGNTYNFSVGPWRLAEYVWPNFSGRQFPIHRRWLEVIPAEGRIWTPSLYMGILPLLLAVGTLRFRRAEPRKLWMSWAVVTTVVASFGWYGLGWLMREMNVDAGVGSPFGGLYWLITVLLPGYAYFRYPAKLLVVAALGLSVLAAWGWDDGFSGQSGKVRRCLLWIGGISIVALIGSLLIRPYFGGWLSGGWLSDVGPDMLFGPLDASGAANDLTMALTQTAVLCGLFYWLFAKASGEKGGGRFIQLAALLIVAVDLAAANGWMVACAPARLWREKSQLAEAISARHADRPYPARVYRHPIWMRPSWRQSSSTDRITESMQWDRATLWPKYNLFDHISILDVQGSLQIKGSDPFSAASLAEYVILPGDKTLPGAERIPVEVPDVSLWMRKNRPNLVFLAGGEKDNLCRVSLLHHDPLRVVVEAELAEAGTVVLREQFYPGWRLEVETTGRPRRELPIARTREAMRGVELPAGRHRLIYSYRPTSFAWGAAISILGWLTVMGWLAMWLYKRAN